MVSPDCSHLLICLQRVGPEVKCSVDRNHTSIAIAQTGAGIECVLGINERVHESVSPAATGSMWSTLQQAGGHMSQKYSDSVQ